MAALSGPLPTMESRGLTELRPEVRVGLVYLYQAQDNIKLRWFIPMAIYGPRQILAITGPSEPPEALQLLGFGIQYHYHQPANTKVRWFMADIYGPHQTSE